MMTGEEILQSAEFKKILDFHGHLCPGLCIGYRAAKAGIDFLRESHSADEELVAIVENDACGVDAVQVLTGCTFGKGNFIFRDYGKQVFTFISRNSGAAVRVSLKPGALEPSPRAAELRKRIASGAATPDEIREHDEARHGKVIEVLERPVAELFNVSSVQVEIPPRAQARASINCDHCGEPTMETRIKNKNGENLCPDCRQKV